MATLWQHDETGRTRVTVPGDITDCDARWRKAADLYTHPQPAPVQQDNDTALLRQALEALKRADKISGYVNNKAVRAALKARLK